MSVMSVNVIFVLSSPVPNLILNGYSVLCVAVVVLFFRADYRRMKEESRLRAGNMLQAEPGAPVIS